jgi:uncharacterized protein (UPF0276 family)
LSEGQFLAAVCDQADCGLLLDLNNAYVNQRNLGEDLQAFISALPLDRVGEVHLAGYSEHDRMLIDSHSSAPSAAVWDCFRDFCALRPDLPCLIEWDSQLPALSKLMEQRVRAQDILDASQAPTAPGGSGGPP